MKRAFTLIELLVVIAIIAILAAILFPVFAQAKQAAKKTTALSNTKQISIALMMYNQDVDDLMPTAMACAPLKNGGLANWSGCGPGAGSIPIDAQLNAYIKSDALWSSPSDGVSVSATGASNIGGWKLDYMWDGTGFPNAMKPRSYKYVGHIVTQEWVDSPLYNNGQDPNTGMSGWASGAISATAMDEPASTIGITEVWTDDNPSVMGSPWGSLFQNCDIAFLAGRKNKPNPTGADVLPTPCMGADPQLRNPTKGYNDTANYVFTDGHAKSLSWGSVRANDFSKFKIAKPSVTYTP